MATFAMELGRKVCGLLNLAPNQVAELTIVINPQSVIRVDVQMLPTTDVAFDDLVLEIIGQPDTVVRIEDGNGTPA